ncbi:unnamed protein product [Trichobilharzia regenti]|nr:unnamed protein product [Trichobilharzia regenti]
MSPCFTAYPKKSVNPYELVFLKFPAFKAFSEIPVKSNYHSFNFSMKPTTTTTLNRHPVPLAGNEDDVDVDDNENNIIVVVSSSLMSSPFVTAVGPYCLPKDKRHRRYILNHLPADQELITGRNTESIFAKNNSVKFNTKYEDEKRKFWTRGRDKSAYYG